MSATAHVGKISAARKANRNNQPVERRGMRAGNQLFGFVRICISTGTFMLFFVNNLLHNQRRSAVAIFVIDNLLCRPKRLHLHVFIV
jgi:hypothetical protein